jgi:hypothetical protein
MVLPIASDCHLLEAVKIGIHCHSATSLADSDTGAEGCCSIECEAADAQAGACLRSMRSKFLQGKENIVCLCLSFGPSTFGMPCSCLLVDDNLTLARESRDQSGLRDQSNETNLLDHKILTHPNEFLSVLSP